MKPGNRRARQTPEQLAAKDAIAFLHSMVKLVDARGWREVHFEFANYVLGMADKILDPDPEGRGECVRLDHNSHASELFEGFERVPVPVPVFKGIVMLLERDLRKDVDKLIEQISTRETSNARRAA